MRACGIVLSHNDDPGNGGGCEDMLMMGIAKVVVMAMLSIGIVVMVRVVGWW